MGFIPSAPTVAVTPAARKELIDFLRKVLPHAPVYFVAEHSPGAWDNWPVQSVEALATEIAEIYARGSDAFFALAGYATKEGGRKQTNVESLRAFWLDIDVGADKAARGKGYASIEDAERALRAFCTAATLQPPLVVCSGYGLHVYWPLDRDVTPEEWQPAAEGLKALCEVHGLRADPARTADSSSVLRPAGTINRKRGASAPVFLMCDAGPFEAGPLLVQLTAAASGKPKAASDHLLANLPESVRDEPHIVPLSNPADHERAVSALRAIPPPKDRETWMGLLWSFKALRVPDGKKIAREWSKLDLDNYNEAVFERDWESGDPERVGGIKGGSLFFIAGQHGWKDPRAGAVAVVADDAVSLPGSRGMTPGDLMHAGIFARLYRGQLLYIHAESKWLRWDGVRWRRCDQGEFMQAAETAARHIVKEAIERWLADTENAALKSALRHAETLAANLPRMKAMVELAQSKEGMSVASAAELDTDPMLLGVKNGTLDLRTGKLLKADPKRLISRIAGCEFLPDAECPRFVGAVSSAFSGDTGMIRYFQQALGYTLTGLVSYQVFFLLFGPPNCGKSLILDVITALLGDYAVVARSDTFSKARISNPNQPRDDLARLQGARLIAVNETSKGQVFDTELLNQIASTGSLVVRFGHGRPFEFKPTGKLWLVGNHMPNVVDGSGAFFRRARVLKFKNVIPKNQVVYGLDAQIIADELPGILNWALAGLLSLPKDNQNWTAPEQVCRDVDAYQEDTDPFSRWMDENIELCPDCTATTAELVQDYELWASQNKEMPISTTAMGKDLGLRGFERGKVKDPRTGKDVRIRKGLRLKYDLFRPAGAAT